MLLTACAAKVSPEAQQVINTIATLVTVDENSGSSIETAEEAFASLTQEQQAEVSNSNKLAAAREKYDTICILAVKQKIQNIGKVDKDSGEAIKEATNAYNELTEIQQLSVDNYAVLTESTEHLAAIKKFRSFADGLASGSSDITTVSGDRNSVKVDTNPKNTEFSGLALSIAEPATLFLLETYNKGFGLPASLVTSMSGTRTSDGKQSKSFDYITVTWSYHGSLKYVIQYELN
jgi:hypothetical protein